MTDTLTYEGTLVVTACWCGIKLAVPNSLYRQAQSSRRSIYCPLGHAFVYNDNKADRLERQLANTQESLRIARAHAQQTEHRLRGTKGALTKAKKRAAAGLCPCCNRSFQNVTRHMKTQHPDFPETDQ